MNQLPSQFNIFSRIRGSKNCCQNWRICILNFECLETQITWNSVREGLHQRNPAAGQLISLDCYFVPPNILRIGLIVKINKEFIYIYFITGELIIRFLEDIFIFPETDLLYRAEEDIKASYRNSIWARRLNTN